jgi:hypothetical protein
VSSIDDYALVDNAADPEQVAGAAFRMRERERERRNRWRTQMSTKEGREFLWEEIFAVLFEFIGTEDVQKLGVRNEECRRWLFANEHPELFLQMQNEAMKRARTLRTENRAARTKRATDTKT